MNLLALTLNQENYSDSNMHTTTIHFTGGDRKNNYASKH